MCGNDADQDHKVVEDKLWAIAAQSPVDSGSNGQSKQQRFLQRTDGKAAFEADRELEADREEKMLTA